MISNIASQNHEDLSTEELETEALNAEEDFDPSNSIDTSAWTEVMWVLISMMTIKVTFYFVFSPQTLQNQSYLSVLRRPPMTFLTKQILSNVFFKQFHLSLRTEKLDYQLSMKYSKLQSKAMRG